MLQEPFRIDVHHHIVPPEAAIFSVFACSLKPRQDILDVERYSQ